MLLIDIPSVCRIEALCFPHPWPRDEFLKELSQNRFAKYFTCKLNRKIIGYMGVWLIFEDAHIATIAVDPFYSRKGIGSILLDFAFNLAKQKGCNKVILEVRKSNEPAKQFYEKHGFSYVNTKKSFYTNPSEDGWEMIKKLSE